MAKISIPDEIKVQVQKIVDNFNRSTLKSRKCRYVIEYKSNFLYLHLDEGLPRLAPTVRLKFNGAIDNWGFALFKWSTEKYSEEELFPGMELVDGTVLGAMRAGFKAYPPTSKNDDIMYKMLAKALGLKL